VIRKTGIGETVIGANSSGRPRIQPDRVAFDLDRSSDQQSQPLEQISNR
jgi:hypothetical protein